jgi:hypothetical protein
MSYDPRHLRYSSEGVPILSAAEIEAIADEVLQKHDAAALRKPTRAGVIEILHTLEKEKGLKVIFADLGLRNEKKILGRMQFPSKTIFLDNVLLAELEQSLRFTAAHELAHWVLHSYAWRKFWSTRAVEESLDDDDDSLFRLEQRSKSDWIEWQANVFASELVMPRRAFPIAVAAIQSTLGMHKFLGEVWISDHWRSRDDYLKICACLAELFGVSRSAVEVRLRTLKLIHDQTAPKRPLAV